VWSLVVKLSKVSEVSKVSESTGLYGSRYGTPGKVHKLKIQNPKKPGTTALLITLDPMNLPPHSPISPSPLLNISIDNNKAMQTKSHINRQLKYHEVPSVVKKEIIKAVIFKKM
jgi:hypothetical protein